MLLFQKINAKLLTCHQNTLKYSMNDRPKENHEKNGNILSLNERNERKKRKN